MTDFEERWREELSRLVSDEQPGDQLIVALEAELEMRGQEGQLLRELLRLGCWPFDELRALIIRGAAPPPGMLQDRRARRLREIAALPAAVILLPLRNEHRDVCEWIIEPACHWEDLRPVLIDQETAGFRTALDKARDVMHSAALFVADVTSLNVNVFYEIGFMDALGRPGALISMNSRARPHYLKDREVCLMRRGLDGMARSREKLRAELRRIRLDVRDRM